MCAVAISTQARRLPRSLTLARSDRSGRFSFLPD
jgi:hypothetical protein